MESTGEIWIEEESPVYLNLGEKKDPETTPLSLTNIDLGAEKVISVFILTLDIAFIPL